MSITFLFLRLYRQSKKVAHQTRSIIFGLFTRIATSIMLSPLFQLFCHFLPWELSWMTLEPQSRLHLFQELLPMALKFLS
eukprot:26486_6